MFEKTLRYPGHVDLMRIFRNAGFLGMTPIHPEAQKKGDKKRGSAKKGGQTRKKTCHLFYRDFVAGIRTSIFCAKYLTKGIRLCI
jgi:hypothetical protein